MIDEMVCDVIGGVNKLGGGVYGDDDVVGIYDWCVVL